MENRHDPLLTVNVGSATVKVALFGEGEIAREELSAGGTGEDILAWARGELDGRTPVAAVHRVVHGGNEFVGATVIDARVLARLRTLVPLAPNHLPDEIALIERLGAAMPGAPQVACFDTAFHHDLPAVARTLPIAGAERLGLRRFGFHGLSYTYLLSALEGAAGAAAANGRVVLAHLGSGASLAAVLGGKSLDTSMGFTPAGGLVMSTRTGDLDPGALVYLMRHDGLSADTLDEAVTKQSGLAAVSGGRADMKALLAAEATDASARLAVDLFCYQAAKWTGAFAAVLGGLDTLVFSGGIGEHAAPVRARICSRLAFLGVALDDASNARHAPVISTAASRVAVRVIPTDEAQVMARDARRVLVPRLP